MYFISSGNQVIVLIFRECSFLSKTLQAQSVGAIAIIIYDYDRENDSKMVDMISDGTDRVAQIPAFYLMGKDG